MSIIQDPMLPELYQIVQKARETHDTFTLELKALSSQKELSFAPGQFNMLYVFGQGEVPISISGDENTTEHLTHTIRAVGSVTQAMEVLEPGESLGIRGPFGSSWPVKEAYGKDVVLVAGGIGLAPLRPVIYHLLTHREEYGNVFLLYGTRTPEDILFEAELHQWRGRFDMEVEVTVDHAENHWHGRVGVVTNLISLASFDPTETIAMICGPEMMMRFTINELRNEGLELDSMYISMERNMKCAIGFCGHCQLGPTFICRQGPVFRFDQIEEWFNKREI